MHGPGLFSIGTGNRTLPELLALLEDHRIATVVDVRGIPFSRFRPEFARDPLAAHLQAAGFSYAWMGDTLGGRCNGAPPSAVRFRSALRRLALMGSDRRVAFLCAELRPESCHRYRLLGCALEEAGVAVQHIDERGLLVPQRDLRMRVTGGQTTFDVVSEPVLAAAS
ncbi:MAG: DUF488 domain-containing protein [Candidatus Thermoplasmatota archaeon]